VPGDPPVKNLMIGEGGTAILIDFEWFSWVSRSGIWP
jgi:hypothetical protein